jgi:hypothetical protein
MILCTVHVLLVHAVVMIVHAPRLHSCSACVHVRIVTVTVNVYAHPFIFMMAATLSSLLMHAYANACLVVVVVVVAKGGHKRYICDGVVKACDGTTALTMHPYPRGVARPP